MSFLKPIINGTEPQKRQTQLSPNTQKHRAVPRRQPARRFYAVRSKRGCLFDGTSMFCGCKGEQNGTQPILGGPLTRDTPHASCGRVFGETWGRSGGPRASAGQRKPAALKRRHCQGGPGASIQEPQGRKIVHLAGHFQRALKGQLCQVARVACEGTYLHVACQATSEPGDAESGWSGFRTRPQFRGHVGVGQQWVPQMKH